MLHDVCESQVIINSLLGSCDNGGAHSHKLGYWRREEASLMLVVFSIQMNAEVLDVNFSFI